MATNLHCTVTQVHGGCKQVQSRQATIEHGHSKSRRGVKALWSGSALRTTDQYKYYKMYKVATSADKKAHVVLILLQCSPAAVRNLCVRLKPTCLYSGRQWDVEACNFLCHIVVEQTNTVVTLTGPVSPINPNKRRSQRHSIRNE